MVEHFLNVTCLFNDNSLSVTFVNNKAFGCSILYVRFGNSVRASSRADMCLNCSLSVKSMKLGMMIVFKALKNIGYGAIAKKSVKCEKYEF